MWLRTGSFLKVIISLLPCIIPLALALHDGVLDGQVLEVRLVQDSVVVDVVHVPAHHQTRFR